MTEICCVGHITLDKVITPHSERFMPGGTAFYFSKAIHQMDVNYELVTSVAQSELSMVQSLRNDQISVSLTTGSHTVYFENSYGQNQDQRTQRVLQMADPFSVKQLDNFQASIFHLGPLLADDIPLDLIKELSKRGRISLDVQGYLRKVENKEVCHIDWDEKMIALKYIHFLKANESEMKVLTGESDVYKAAILLSQWGVKEVILTLGSLGSVIYTDNAFYNIPAYPPVMIIDATGCGDTYMAGYLYKRLKGQSPQEAGEFAAAMASLKIAGSGPFSGNEADVLEFFKKNKMPLAV